jgi:hypothetical protein
MSKIDKFIEEETEASEQNRDAPLAEQTKLSRPNRQRSTVFSIRLKDPRRKPHRCHHKDMSVTPRIDALASNVYA